MRKTQVAMTAATAACAAALALPAASPAATVTITGDTGTPVTLAPGAPAAMRQMHPDVSVALAGTEKGVDVSVAGPVAPAITPRTCSSGGVPSSMDYQGNGTYTITVSTYTNSLCTTGKKTATYAVAINASIALTAPAGPVLTRQPNSYASNTLRIPVAVNPGALTHDLHVAADGVLAPDGSISGPSKQVYLDDTTGTAGVTLDEPGRYVMVGRATGYTGGAGQFFSPWSAPIHFRAYAPFDFVGKPTWPDSRGPSYKMRVALQEKTARGKVTIKLAKGRRGGKFRSIGKAKIRRGVFKKRFTRHQLGVYRAKFIFKGSATTAPGTVKTAFRIKRFF